MSEIPDYIVIDGVRCDIEKVKEAVTRCVLSAQRLQRFTVEVPSRSAAVEALCADLQAILKGERLYA